MSVTLVRAEKSDLQTVLGMQVEAFTPLLEKYKDYETSPASESLERITQKFEQRGSHYFFIEACGARVGVIRVVEAGGRKRISPIWIMSAFRGRGYARDAIKEAERIFGPDSWEVDTILQEDGLLCFYEKMGYRRTGKTQRINGRMDIVFLEKGIKSDEKKAGKSWHRTFMSIAREFAAHSTCIKYKIGAVLVKDLRVISAGYNGTPSGMRHCEDEFAGLPMDDEKNRALHHEFARKYELHAEQNCIAYAARNNIGIDDSCVLYVTHSPCNDCTKLIIAAGIRTVVFESVYKRDFDSNIRLLKDCGVRVLQIQTDDRTDPL